MHMATLFEGDVIRFIQNPGQGFFSCCTIQLQGILKYFNQFHQLPRRVDSTEQFLFYKTPQNWNEDIKHDYFLDQEIDPKPFSFSPPDYPIKTTNLEKEDQFSDYRYLNYTDLLPFIQRYFAPTPMITTLIEDICEKYDIKYENTCVLFYRGNDKATEVTLPTYDQYVLAARNLLASEPHIRFLVQSDETEFLDAMKAEFPDNHVIFYDEIRHMPQCLTTVDKAFRYQNAVMSKLYLAITLVMSRCKYVVCSTGNCSMWIALFRGNMHGVTQF